jgi:hypothetical protein
MSHSQNRRGFSCVQPQSSWHHPQSPTPSSPRLKYLKMSINRFPTIDIQNILSQISLNSPLPTNFTYLRTRAKSHHTIHLCSQTNILPLFARRFLKAQTRLVVRANGDVHEEIQGGGCELWWFDAYLVSTPCPSSGFTNSYLEQSTPQLNYQHNSDGPSPLRWRVRYIVPRHRQRLGCRGGRMWCLRLGLGGAGVCCCRVSRLV